MIAGAPFPAAQSGACVLLWHPRAGAYLRHGGEGFTRRLAKAARVTREEARRLKASGHLGHLEIEPCPEGPQSNRPGAAPGLRRAAWADLTDEDLLRRAVLALLSGGGAASLERGDGCAGAQQRGCREALQAAEYRAK